MSTKSPSRLIRGQRIYPVTAERMRHVRDDSVDVIVTSPPYNRGKLYSGDTTPLRYDDRMSEPDYLALLGRIFAECHRTIRKDGLFFLNVGDSANDQGKSERVVKVAETAGFRRVQTIAWVKSLLGKGHYTPSGGSRRLNNCWESVFILAKSRKYRFDPKAIGIPYADKSNIGRYGETDLRDAGNVWLLTYSKTTGHSTKKGHDAPFPIELPYRCIKLVPNARVVLDPFGGTMSTLAAAHALGLRGVGFEPFPRWQVIEGVIAEGAAFSPPVAHLIPELEHAVDLLMHLLREATLDEALESTFAHARLRKTDRELLTRMAAQFGRAPGARARRHEVTTLPLFDD